MNSCCQQGSSLRKCGECSTRGCTSRNHRCRLGNLQRYVHQRPCHIGSLLGGQVVEQVGCRLIQQSLHVVALAAGVGRVFIDDDMVAVAAPVGVADEQRVHLARDAYLVVVGASLEGILSNDDFLGTDGTVYLIFRGVENHHVDVLQVAAAAEGIVGQEHAETAVVSVAYL